MTQQVVKIFNSGLLSHSDLAAELATNWRLFLGNLDQVLADLRYPMNGAPFHSCKVKERQTIIGLLDASLRRKLKVST